MQQQRLLIGGGGHAVSVADALGLQNIDLAGYIDPVDHGRLLDYIPRLGDDEALVSRDPATTLLYNCIGSVGDMASRRAIYTRFHDLGFQFETLVHPDATCSSHAALARATQVMARAVLGPGTQTGINTLINTGAIIEHGCHIGNHCHIASGAVLCGSVYIGDGTHVGAGATILQDIRIGDGAIIAAGSVVTKNVKPMTLVAGVPAKPVRTLIRAS